MARADRALARSRSGLIVAITPRGSATIYREGEAGHDSANVFHVCFTPSAPGKVPDAAGAVVVGSYDDLDMAVTIAAVGYGTKEAEWMPADDE